MSTRKQIARKNRHMRVRRNISGTPERPRLNVFRSSRHIYAQIIDDTVGNTLVAVSTLDSEVAANVGKKTKKEQAAEVGKVIAERAKAAGIDEIIFDRGGYRYHGRVKSLADAAREGGLKF